MKKYLLMAMGLLVFTTATAHALPVQSRTLQYVYGTGWAMDDGWVTPMTEVAADAIIALEAAKKTKAVCDTKGVFQAAEWNQSVLDFLAYDIENCQ